MKKLMIAAAIVCAAVVSEASTFKWASEDVAYMPYAITSIKEGADQPSATSKTSKQLESWAGDGAVFTATIALSLDGGSTWETTYDVPVETNSGNIDVSGIENANFVKPTAEGVQNNVMYKIVINGTYNDGTTDWVLASSEITGTAPLTSLSPEQLTTGVPASWTITTGAAPVPEPTSGLLLLLGVAGLALKRKRA